MDDQGIAGLRRDVLPPQRLLQVVDRDLVRVWKHVHALQARNVNQHTAGHQRAHLLDSQLGEAGPRRRFVDLVTVVHAVADRLVAEAVELRADLTNLGDDDLLVAAAAVRFGIHGGALRVHLETAGAGQRHRSRKAPARARRPDRCVSAGRRAIPSRASCDCPRPARHRRPTSKDSAERPWAAAMTGPGQEHSRQQRTAATAMTMTWRMATLPSLDLKLTHGDGPIPHEMGAGIAVLAKRRELGNSLVDLRLIAQSGLHQAAPAALEIANHVLYPA